VAKNSSNPNTPKPGSSTLYRDPASSLRDGQSQTIGSRAAMVGRSGSVSEMKAAAKDSSRFPKAWKPS
jgi:hypothetical protein